jgi:hypothetical protein
VVKSSTRPKFTLKRKHDAINYHCVREVQAAEYILVTWIDGKKNLANALTKVTVGDRHGDLVMVQHEHSNWEVFILNSRRSPTILSLCVGSRSMASKQNPKRTPQLAIAPISHSLELGGYSISSLDRLQGTCLVPVNCLQKTPN